MITNDRLEPQSGFSKASGGFGTVRVAKFGDQLVAVKELHIPGDDIDRLRFIKRFARELKVWAPLEHPNLLKLHGFYLCPEMLIAKFISPFYPLGHVGDYLRQHNPDLIKRYDLVEDTAFGLRHLHNLKIVHGDLKESNVLVNSQLRAILCDYGLAKMIDEDDQPSGLTTTKAPMSVRFASVELLNGLPRRMPSDIWAWGCLFLAIVANIIPYMDAPIDFACMLSIAKGNPPVDTASLTMHASLKGLMSRCWNHDPVARPTIVECIEILESIRPRREPQPWEMLVEVSVKTLGTFTRAVNDVAFSPAGSLLASVSDDRNLRLWDVDSGAASTTLICGAASTASVDTVAFSPNGTRLASGASDGEIWVWDAIPRTPTSSTLNHTSWRLTRKLFAGRASVWSVVFSPDGLRIGAGLGGGDVQMWDGASGEPLTSLMGHDGWVRKVNFSPDGKWLASCSDDKTVRIWDATPTMPLGTFSKRSKRPPVVTLETGTKGLHSVAFSPDGRWLASVSDHQVIQVWDVPSWKRVAMLQSDAYILSLAFSPSGRRLVSGMISNDIQIWDTESWRRVMALKGHSGPVVSLAFSPDGTRIASCSVDKTVRMWQTTPARTHSSPFASEIHPSTYH